MLRSRAFLCVCENSLCEHLRKSLGIYLIELLAEFVADLDQHAFVGALERGDLVLVTCVHSVA